MVSEASSPSGELTDVFARMSALLFNEETLQSTLDLVSALAHETLVRTAGAGVTMVDQGRKYTAAYSDEIAKEADSLQYEYDEGPCLSAWKEQQVFRIDWMPGETRWPRWAPAVAELGMISTLSVPLIVHDRSIGAIKVYSRNRSNYDERDERVLAMFARQAAIVLANARAFTDARQLSEQLKDALKSREWIGEAKGILMEREGVDEEAAFAMLRQASQHENIKLREIAEELVRRTARRAGD